MMAKKKIGIRKIAYQYCGDSSEVIRINTLRRKYIFVDYFDAPGMYKETNKAEFLSIASQYKSYEDYCNDKALVCSLIDNAKPIPDDLDRRLVITKHELERE